MTWPPVILWCRWRVWFNLLLVWKLFKETKLRMILQTGETTFPLIFGV